MPTSGFNSVDSNLISTGSVAVDKKKNVVWVSILAPSPKGEILRYNIISKTFDTFHSA